MTLDESIRSIRPYNLERIHLLKNIENVLLKYSLIHNILIMSSKTKVKILLQKIKHKEEIKLTMKLYFKLMEKLQ